MQLKITGPKYMQITETTGTHDIANMHHGPFYVYMAKNAVYLKPLLLH